MLHPTPIPDRARNSGWNVISHCRFFSLSLQGLRNQMVWGGKKNTPPYRLHIQSYMQPQGLPVDRSFSAWGFVCTYVWVCLSCSFLLLPFGGALRKEYLWRISHFSKETKRRTFPGEEEEWHQMDKACQNLSRGHSGARPFCRMCLYRWSVASIRIFSFCFCVCVPPPPPPPTLLEGSQDLVWDSFKLIWLYELLLCAILNVVWDFLQSVSL